MNAITTVSFFNNDKIRDIIDVKITEDRVQIYLDKCSIFLSLKQFDDFLQTLMEAKTKSLMEKTEPINLQIGDEFKIEDSLS